MHGSQEAWGVKTALQFQSLLRINSERAPPGQVGPEFPPHLTALEPPGSSSFRKGTLRTRTTGSA